MMKPAAAAAREDEEEDVQVLVERPYSHEGPPHLPRPPHHHQQHIRARPYYRRWSPWIVSAAAAACVALFLVTMYVNDCPRHNTNCAAGFLG
ncbi:RHOMBOID-like protein 2 [Panicum miliaceum]|uniref:RHOMBOID-like protein 2 n=1 Tax=Panicum miliaceum TaxID=4540 RepID=A0A3L6Q5V1_PANMI|nr:RHOMBOID-like protein 2 [Panicum miliaceum]